MERLKNTGLGVRRPRSWPCRLLNVSLGQVIHLFQAPVNNKNCDSNNDVFTVTEMPEGIV